MALADFDRITHADLDEYPERDGDVCASHLVTIIGPDANFERCMVCRKEYR